MEGAEEALRGDDLGEAIDRQSEAMEALRDGMRNLGEQWRRTAKQQQGGQGQARGQPGQQQNDPLGRAPGQGQQVGTRRTTCCKAKTCTAVRVICWTKSAAAQVRGSVRTWNWITSSGCLDRF